MNDKCSLNLINFADRLANAARRIVLPYFRSKVVVEDKFDGSPVTPADRAVESELRRLIADEYPLHGVMGEEEEPYQRDSDYVWVIDPIDGTKAFICGIPVFGTLLALTFQGSPILGVLDQPVLDERWVGALGHPTVLNGAPVRTRPCPSLSLATLCATTPHMFAGIDAAPFDAVRRAVKLIRYGTDCYAYGLLASGHIDLIVEADVALHDYMAHVPILQGAGGFVTDWEGRSLNLNRRATRLVAAGAQSLHRETLACIAANQGSASA